MITVGHQENSYQKMEPPGGNQGTRAAQGRVQSALLHRPIFARRPSAPTKRAAAPLLRV